MPSTPLLPWLGQPIADLAVAVDVCRSVGDGRGTGRRRARPWVPIPPGSSPTPDVEAHADIAAPSEAERGTVLLGIAG
jgi:hypothetical protein